MLSAKRRQTYFGADKEYRLYWNDTYDRRLYAKEQDGVLMRYPHKNKPKYTPENDKIWETMAPKSIKDKIFFRVEEWKVVKWPLPGAKVKVFEDEAYEGEVDYKYKKKGFGQ